MNNNFKQILVKVLQRSLEPQENHFEMSSCKENMDLARNINHWIKKTHRDICIFDDMPLLKVKEDKIIGENRVVVSYFINYLQSSLEVA